MFTFLGGNLQENPSNVYLILKTLTLRLKVVTLIDDVKLKGLVVLKVLAEVHCPF